MSIKKLNWAILFTLAAVLIHAYLTKQYYGLKFGQAETSFCNLNATFNCDAASASSYSNIAGIPMALFGALTNLVLLLFLLANKYSLVQEKERLTRVYFYLALAIAGVSVIMGSISTFLLHTYCLFCMATYLLSFFNLYLLGSNTQGSVKSNLGNDFKSLFGDFKTVLVLLALVPVLAYVINDMAFEASPLKDIDRVAAEKVDKWKSSTEYNFNPQTGLIKKARQEPAQMTVVEFADFRCPHCKHAYPTLHAFAAAHPDVEFIFKPFPLDGTCNTAMQGGGDGISCELAFLTFCGEKLAGQGWKVHDYIFENQERILGLSRLDDIRAEISARFAINQTELETCAKSGEIFQAVQDMAKEGANAQVQGTPSIYLNGKYLQGGHLLPILEKAYKNIK